MTAPGTGTDACTFSHALAARFAPDGIPARAVTFIVTLAATRSVTLAARESDMTRPSVYALKARDPAFASARVTKWRK